MPLTVLTGDTPPFTPIYSPDDADVLLLAFESDSWRNTGTGFKVSYEVSNDDIDAMTGCNDPLATNYDAAAIIPKQPGMNRRHVKFIFSSSISPL